MDCLWTHFIDITIFLRVNRVMLSSRREHRSLKCLVVDKCFGWILVEYGNNVMGSKQNEAVSEDQVQSFVKQGLCSKSSSQTQ